MATQDAAPDASVDAVQDPQDRQEDDLAVEEAGNSEIDVTGSDDDATVSNNRENEVATGSDDEAAGSGEDQSDDVQFVGTTQEEGGSQRSRAKTEALMAARGIVTPDALEAEFQCSICQYAMFKPVTVFCGHSFCRVCLMDSFLTRSIEEAQCPICRVEILQPLSARSSPASIFNVNVTLWNAVQLLIPSVASRIASYQNEEEEEYTHKLDQLDAKWKIFFLNETAARYHGDHDEQNASRSGDESPSWEEQRDGHSDFPVLKIENNDDGNLQVSRNVVLDVSDANEDGIMNMRVGLAIVEFPSIFELYNEHQECSLNIIKMEEDEEMADGMPFFMSESGDDDMLVCGSYYNQLTLRICDDGGNCVMERTRGAQAGHVSFPGLRLDVPGGMYTFRFSDDLYGLKLSITLQLREPHEISDTPVADYVSLINDEARDARRRNRRGQYSEDEGDYYDEGNESDDSFIVNDLDEEHAGHFSDEEILVYNSDDEAADEAREQRRMRRRRQQQGETRERAVQLVEEHQEEDDVSDGDAEPEHDADDEERTVQLVHEHEEAAFSSDEEGDTGGDHGEPEDAEEEDHHEEHRIVQSRRRNTNQIVDSEDEDTGEEVGDDEQDANGETHIDESEDEASAPANGRRKVTREQYEEDDGSDANFSDGDASDTERRPQKRVRNVQIVESDEEDEDELEQSIEVARAFGGDMEGDEEAEEEVGDSLRTQETPQFYEDGDGDDEHVYDEAQQEEDDVGPDYPEEEEEEDIYQEEDDGYADAGEFSE